MGEQIIRDNRRRKQSREGQTARKIVEEVLGARDAKELWSIGYRPVLPITPQDFSLESVLPAVLYMMRWGHRRGKGKFADVYGREASIAQVAERLVQDEKGLAGFNDKVQQAILGDLLLCYCLENKGHRTGREEQVQRVFPTHYFSSWIDLPREVANLRSVPELVVAMLSRQPKGTVLMRGNCDGHYVVGSGFEKNLLLALFGLGASIEGQSDNLRSDRFNEEQEVGLDQLLAIRLARSLEEAPQKARGENPEIPNQLPIAQLASESFVEDFNVFLRAFGKHVPRQSLLPMLESCLAIGMSNIYFSTLGLMLHWAESGTIHPKNSQLPWPLFVDCSVSTDAMLRRFSEECMDDLMRRLKRLPVCMMCLRVLDQRARVERLKSPPSSEPDPTAGVNFLGDLLLGRSDVSEGIERDIRQRCNSLSDALKEAEEMQVCEILNDEEVHPAWRLAEALVVLMGDRLQIAHYRKCLDSCLMIDQPNGLGRKRRKERRSIVLTNTVLDFLVHRHLRKAKKGTVAADLSLADFIAVLRKRYGFYIDEAPPGLSVPADLLRKNRDYLERRLRDLGLLVGVSDAEAMKRLRQRFEVDNADSE